MPSSETVEHKGYVIELMRHGDDEPIEIIAIEKKEIKAGVMIGTWNLIALMERTIWESDYGHGLEGIKLIASLVDCRNRWMLFNSEFDREGVV